MKTPTPRTLLNFLQAQGVSNSLQHNWPAQTTRKGNRKDCCPIKQEENIPCRPPSQGRGHQKAQWHNTSYGWSRLQAGQAGRGFHYFYGYLINITKLKVTLTFLLGPEKALWNVHPNPPPLPPGQAFSPHNKILCIPWCKRPDADHTCLKEIDKSN